MSWTLADLITCRARSESETYREQLSRELELIDYYTELLDTPGVDDEEKVALARETLGVRP